MKKMRSHQILVKMRPKRVTIRIRRILAMLTCSHHNFLPTLLILTIRWWPRVYQERLWVVLMNNQTCTIRYSGFLSWKPKKNQTSFWSTMDLKFFWPIILRMKIRIVWHQEIHYVQKCLVKSKTTELYKIMSKVPLVISLAWAKP